MIEGALVEVWCIRLFMRDGCRRGGAIGAGLAVECVAWRGGVMKGGDREMRSWDIYAVMNFVCSGYIVV